MSGDRIFKFPLEVTDVQDVSMSSDAVILSAIEQYGAIVVYARVNPNAVASRRRFFVVGTGHPLDRIDPTAVFVGTVKTEGGALIWHVFVGGEVAQSAL